MPVYIHVLKQGDYSDPLYFVLAPPPQGPFSYFVEGCMGVKKYDYTDLLGKVYLFNIQKKYIYFHKACFFLNNYREKKWTYPTLLQYTNLRRALLLLSIFYKIFCEPLR